MVNLDDRSFISKTASGEAVLRSIDAFPLQCQQAWTESSQIVFPKSYRTVKNVVVCGMGGSRFTPIIVKELFKDTLIIPYSVNDNYELPAYVNEDTLLILSSYSGTTEEVLQCAQSAVACRAKIVGLCVGGAIGDYLQKNNFPVYLFNPKYNTSNQPRIGVGYMVMGHIGLLWAAGLLPVDNTSIESTLAALPKHLANFQIDVPTSQNPSKQLAENLYGKYAYYIAAEHLQGVGNAIANQTNETAKAISSFRIIPELNHHLMEGLKFPETLKDIAVFVFFPSKLYDRRVQIRFNITGEIVQKNSIKTHIHTLKGISKLEQVLEMIGFGSYMTMYLSALYQQDPASIPWVDYFKKRLKELT